MRLRTELRLGIGALLAVQALTTLAAVSLLGRMGPAVDVVMQENVVSIEAAEDMLAAVADPSPESTQHFIDGLARARANVTEEAEPALLDVLEARGPAALNGDAEARHDTVKAARALAEVNRDGMAKASVAARWRAFAGAWSAVLLGLLSFALSLVLTRRLRARIDDPLQELAAALEGVQEGCAVRRVSELVNRLLDDRRSTRSCRSSVAREMIFGAPICRSKAVTRIEPSRAFSPKDTAQRSRREGASPAKAASSVALRHTTSVR